MPTQPQAWTLPEGIESPAPGEVARLERLRRQLLDLYICRGYLQTSPPFVEFADRLQSRDSHTNGNLFEWTDPLSGRQLALRDDATAQVARVRAVQMTQAPDPVRLCYCLPVVHRKAESLDTPRLFYQVGAELFGATTAEADEEILLLMVQSVQQAGIDEVIVSLGHTAFFSSLMASADVQGELRRELLSLLQRRAIPEIDKTMRDAGLKDTLITAFKQLANAHGEIGDLAAMAKPFAHLPAVPEAINEMLRLREILPNNCRVLFDLGDVHHRLYHQGLVFACFTPAHGAAVARGGRYPAADGSPAVGFSASLWLLAALGRNNDPHRAMRVFAPPNNDPKLQAEIDRLREAGTVVVRGFAGADKQRDPACTHLLQKQATGWALHEAEAEAEAN